MRASDSPPLPGPCAGARPPGGAGAHARVALLLATAIVLAGCHRATPVSIANRSGAAIEQVVVSGAGFERSLGTIEPGATVATLVHPRGESGLALSFRAGGRPVMLAPSGYVESGGRYRVRIVVDADLRADVQAGPGRY